MDEDSRTLFVASLPEQVTEDLLYELLLQVCIFLILESHQYCKNWLKKDLLSGNVEIWYFNVEKNFTVMFWYCDETLMLKKKKICIEMGSVGKLETWAIQTYNNLKLKPPEITIKEYMRPKTNKLK